jgi:acyl phosphate:glycerol-3-phosphate acyltransferase
MLTLAIVVVGSYLLGSIPFGYLAGRVASVDIRKTGSRNIGATNVVRVLGKRYGYPVFALDFLKGFGAVKMSVLIAEGARPEFTSPEIFGVIAAVSSVLGHCFSPWLKFKGGKGVATSAGALFGLMPLVALIGTAIWILIFWLTRYVSLASVATAVALPPMIFILGWQNPMYGKPLFWFSVAVAAVVIWRHRSNLSRLLRGTEPRFIRK